MGYKWRTVKRQNAQRIPASVDENRYIVTCECGRKVRFQDSQAARCHCGRLYMAEVTEVRIRFDDRNLYTAEEAAVLDERFGTGE